MTMRVCSGGASGRMVGAVASWDDGRGGYTRACLAVGGSRPIRACESAGWWGARAWAVCFPRAKGILEEGLESCRAILQGR